MDVDFRRAALEYAAIGWKVFPLAAGTKIPAIKGGHGVKDATDDTTILEAISKKYPRANLGLACGEPSGVVVVDVDPRHGGFHSLATLAAMGRIFPEGPRARTGNGGLHMFYRFQPGISNSSGRLGAGIDIKSTGGSVTLSPSFTKKSKDGPGGLYAWEKSIFGTPLPRLPIWLSTLLTTSRSQKFAPVDVNTSSTGSGAANIDHLANFVAGSKAGDRNNRLHWAACRASELIQQNKASRNECVARLTAAAMLCGLFGPEVIKTIESGLKVGDK